MYCAEKLPCWRTNLGLSVRSATTEAAGGPSGSQHSTQGWAVHETSSGELYDARSLRATMRFWLILRDFAATTTHTRLIGHCDALLATDTCSAAHVECLEAATEVQLAHWEAPLVFACGAGFHNPWRPFQAIAQLVELQRSSIHGIGYSTCLLRMPRKRLSGCSFVCRPPQNTGSRLRGILAHACHKASADAGRSLLHQCIAFDSYRELISALHRRSRAVRFGTSERKRVGWVVGWRLACPEICCASDIELGTCVCPGYKSNECVGLPETRGSGFMHTRFQL